MENFWQGLRCEVMVPCIAPCGKNRPGQGSFEVEKLIAFKGQEMSKFPCMVSGCNQLQDIDQLLRNAPPSQPHPQQMLGEQLTNVQGELRQIRTELAVREDRDKQRFEILTNNQRIILSQVDQQFAWLMQMLIDEAKDGPRLFSFQPVDPGFGDRPKWMAAKFRLTLWCEHDKF